MSQYIVDSTRTVDGSQRFVLAIPLAVTMVFCFAFVAMVHPSKKSDGVSAAQGADNTKSSSNSLPAIPMTTASATTLSATETSTNNSSSASGDSSNSSNQPSNTNANGSTPATTAAPSTPKTTAPQSASQNHGSSPVVIRVGKTKIKL